MRRRDLYWGGRGVESGRCCVLGGRWADFEVEGKGHAQIRGQYLDRVRNPCSDGLWWSRVWWSWWRADRSWHRVVFSSTNPMFTFSRMANVTNCVKLSSEAFGIIVHETVYANAFS